MDWHNRYKKMKSALKLNRMSKRCKLQKEYYKEFGTNKGVGKYTDHYVKWLESEVLALRLCDVVKPYCSHELNKRYWFTSESKCLDCGEYI